MTARTGFGTKVRCIRIALEDVDVALTTVKCEDGYTLKLLTAVTAHASLQLEFHVKPDVDGVGAAIELDGAISCKKNQKSS